MEKLITVDLESWLIDHVSVLIASLLPETSERPPIPHTQPLCFNPEWKKCIIFVCCSKHVIFLKDFMFGATSNFILAIL